MDELKSVFASNLIKLRTASGMTQAELGCKLNYSDKSVSKWERAEALPDAYNLKKLAELFNTTVDELLSEEPNIFNTAKRNEPGYSRKAVLLVSLSGLWTIAVLVFVVCWIFIGPKYIILACAIPASIVLMLIFNSIWNHGLRNYWFVATLIPVSIGVLYLIFLSHNPWQIFLIIIPAEFVAFFSFKIGKHNKK